MKRAKYTVLIVVLIATAFLISAIFNSQNKSDLRKTDKKSRSILNTMVVKNDYYKFPINSSGRMYAYNKVELYAEVNGVLELDNDKFKPGNKFANGETLIKINSDSYYNSLLANRSNYLNQLTILLADLKSESSQSYKLWLEYFNQFDINKPLTVLPDNLDKREITFLASHNILNLYYQIKGMEATYAKYQIKAPFDGTVISSLINPGTLVRNGQKLGEFISTSLYEMEVPIQESDLNKIFIGKKVELSSLNGQIINDAQIVRINSSVDQQTQSIKIYIQSSNKNIIDGMYYDVKIKSVSDKKLAKIPLTAVSKDNEVKIKVGKIEKYVAVKIIEKTPVYYFVEGIADNTTIVINNITK